MKVYLHTIDKRPAGFDGTQLVFVTKKRGSTNLLPLVKDLKTVRQQQKATIKYRKENWGEEYIQDSNMAFTDGRTTYDYVIMENEQEGGGKK